MRDASLSRAPRARRALACVGLASVVAGLLMLGAAPGSAAASNAPARAAGTTHCSSVTVPGKNMYDPTTHKPFPNASTVTVSQACNLVKQ